MQFTNPSIFSIHRWLCNTQVPEKALQCNVCLDLLTIDRVFLFDENSQPEFRLQQLTDRGRLKYPSQIVLNSIVTLWKTLVAVESKDNLMAFLCKDHLGPRKILVQLALIFLEETDQFGLSSCISCGVSIFLLL